MSKHSKSSLNMNFKAIISFIIALVILVSTVICVPIVFSSAEEEQKPYIQVDVSKKKSRIEYFSDSTKTDSSKGKPFASGKYYKLTIDYKILSGTPTFEFLGKISNSNDFVTINSLCQEYSEKDIITDDGICQKVIKFKVNSGGSSKNITRFKIVIGKTEGDQKASVICGYPNIEMYTDATYTTVYVNKGTTYAGTYYVTNLEKSNCLNKYNNDGDVDSLTLDSLKWNFLFHNWQADTTLQLKSAPLSEYNALFAPPEYMIDFYKGGQNNYAVYQDSAFSSSDQLKLTCNFKEISGTSIVKVQTNNGTDWNDISVNNNFDPSTLLRTITFNGADLNGGLRIVVGNKSENLEVASSIGNFVLKKSDDTGVNLIKTLATNVEKSDETALEEKSWNLIADADNRPAIEVNVVPSNYFVPETVVEDIKYESTANNDYAKIEYHEDLTLKKDTTYVFTAKLKLKSGDFSDNNDILNNDDPIMSIFVGGNPDVGGKRVNQENKDIFGGDNLVGKYDPINNDVYIKFTPDTTYDNTAVYIKAGNNTSSSESSIKFAYPKLCEVKGTKADGTTILSHNSIIAPLNNNTIETITWHNKKWNIRGSGYSTSSITSTDFAPADYMYEFFKGGQNNYAVYQNSSFTSSNQLKLTCDYKVFSGNPVFKIQTLSGSVWTDINVNDNIDTDNCKRTITFNGADLTGGLRILTGNPTANKDVNFAVGSILLKNADDTGDNLIEKQLDNVKKNPSDSLEDNKWNLIADNRNSVATKVTKIPDEFFVPDVVLDAEDIMYESKVGGRNNHIEYRDSGLRILAANTYTFKAKIKVIGTVNKTTIGDKIDPIVSLMLKGYFWDDKKLPIKLGSNDLDFVDINFDEDACDLEITFSTKKNQTGFHAFFGSLSDPSIGSVSIAYPEFYEVVAKPKVNPSNDNEKVEYVRGPSLITRLTNDSIQDMGDRLEKKWNVRYSGTADASHITDTANISYFTPYNAYIKINKSFTNDTITYLDSNLQFEQGKRYQFKIDYQKLSGKSLVDIYANDSGYKIIKESADFISYYNEEIDKVNFVKTITFETNKNITGFKFLAGNDGNPTSSFAIQKPTLYEINKSDASTLGENLVKNMLKSSVKENSLEEKVWSMNSTTITDFDTNAPAPDDLFSTPQLVKFSTGTTWNHIEYPDETVSLKSGKTYRFSMDYKSGTGSPEFFIGYNKSNSISQKSSYYKEYFDPDTSIRSIEFTLKEDVTGIFIIVGNFSDSSQITCFVANPTLYEIESNEIVGSNKLLNITSKTVNDVNSHYPADATSMQKANISKLWNFRHGQGKGNIARAFTITDLEDSFFRAPAAIASTDDAGITQVVNAKPSTTYALIFKHNKTAGGVPHIEAITTNGSKSITPINSFNNTDGYYNCRYEFTTPSNLVGSNNLVVGVDLQNATNSIFTDFELFELTSGFDKIGSSLINNGNFSDVEDSYNHWNLNNVNVTERAETCFKQPVSQLLAFAAKNCFEELTGELGSKGGKISKTASAKPGNQYSFSINVKYANMGYDGDTGVQIAYKKNGEWVNLDILNESNTEYKYSANFVMPNDADSSDNFKFTVLANSGYVSGYVANAELLENGIGENLFDNGYLYYGIIGWTMSGSFNVAITSEIPENHFSKVSSTTPHMLVYRNTGSWVRFNQSITLKPDTYYKMVANGVHPWQQNDELVSETAFQTFTRNYVIHEKALLDVNGSYTAKFDMDPKYAEYIDKAIVNIKYYKMSDDIGSWKTISQDLSFSDLTKNGNVYTYDFEIPSDVSTEILKDKNDKVTSSANVDLTFSINCAYPKELLSDGSDSRISITKDSTSQKLTKTVELVKGDKFTSVVKDNPNLVSGTNGNVTVKYFKTPSNLVPNENISTYLYMEGIESAGYWGDMALYECNANGELINGSNIILNNDFSLGDIVWTHTGDFVYRNVEQPENFFKTYKKNDDTMVESNGSEQNAQLGQWVDVERGKKYYFSCFYVSMNGAGINPKVIYKNTNGEFTVATLGDIYKTSGVDAVNKYDSSRFFYEASFQLPEDAASVRGKAQVKFLIDNEKYGKGYVTQMMVCEEGKYTNLLKNPKFADGFNYWVGNDNTPYNGANYRILPFDETVFTFYYDDQLFDDGDWAGVGKKSTEEDSEDSSTTKASKTITTGRIHGSVVDGEKEPIKDLKIILNDNKKSVKTSKTGEFNFYDLKPGNYKISIETPDGSVIVAKEEVPVKAGIVTNISEFVLMTIGDAIKYGNTKLKNKYYGVVCGYLFDADTVPLKGQKIYLGTIASQTTKAKGIFQFNDVPAGTYDIYTKLSDGSICILKRVKVVAGKGAIYKLRLPGEESNLLALILAISGGAVVLIGGILATVLLILKKKKKA